MKPYTDHQLMLALAKELPEHLRIAPDIDHLPNIVAWAYPLTPLTIPTPHEWDWIVRECEKKLGASYQLMINISKISNKTPWGFASWQTRAIAYFQTINKQIE